MTSYTIIVSGVMRTVHTVNGSVTNTTLTVPSCGASAVTVSAVNDVDSSDKSEPKIFSKIILIGHTYLLSFF